MDQDTLGRNSEDAGSLVVLEEGHATTRRRFLLWLTGASEGAAGVLGGLAGLAPSESAAAIIRCNPPTLEAGCLACRGVCQVFQSCCRRNLSGAYCCCECKAGPGQCSPAAFRSENFCSFESICCCTTC